MEYEIKQLNGPFGYRREGGGRVVYLFNSEVDFQAIEQVTDASYAETTEDEDGEEIIDFSEYDPSVLDTDLAGELEDEISMLDICKRMKGDVVNHEKFKSFLESAVLAENIPLIFIDSVTQTISQISVGDDLDNQIDTYRERLIIYIREYDHAGDY